MLKEALDAKKKNFEATQLDAQIVELASEANLSLDEVDNIATLINDTQISINSRAIKPKQKDELKEKLKLYQKLSDLNAKLKELKPQPEASSLGPVEPSKPVESEQVTPPEEEKKEEEKKEETAPSKKPKATPVFQINLDADTQDIVKRMEEVKEEPMSIIKCLKKLAYLYTFSRMEGRDPIYLLNAESATQEIQSLLGFVRAFLNEVGAFKEDSLFVEHLFNIMRTAENDSDPLPQILLATKRVEVLSTHQYQKLAVKAFKAKEEAERPNKMTFLLMGYSQAGKRDFARTICKLPPATDEAYDIERDFFAVYELSGSSFQFIDTPDLDTLTPESEIVFKLAIQRMAFQTYVPLVVVDFPFLD